MLRRLERSHDNVIGYSMAGEVTEEEYGQAVSELRDVIAQYGSVRLLFRLKDLSASAFFSGLDERFRFVEEHRKDVDRVAVVTDDTAAGLLSKVSELIPSVDIETFPRDDEDKAWAWLE